MGEMLVTINAVVSDDTKLTEIKKEVSNVKLFKRVNDIIGEI